MASPKPYKIDSTIERYLEGAVGVVDATGCETLALWQRYHKEMGKQWDETRSGYLVTVGHYNKRPVCLCLDSAIVDGHKIIFVDACSQMVDHKLIDKWMKLNMPKSAYQDRGNGKYVNRTNAMNFHNVFPRP